MIKDIYNRFKENFYMSFMYSSFLIFIFLIVYILLYMLLNIMPLTSVFSFLLFLIIATFLIGFITPSIYSFFVCNNLFNNKEGINVDFKLFLANRKPGKNRIIKSQLKVFPTLLYSILIYLGITIFVITIVSFINMLSNNTNSFYGFYLEISKLGDINNYNEYVKKYNEIYDSYSSYINHDLAIAGLFASFPAFYYFIHHILISLMKYYIINQIPIKTGINERSYRISLNDKNVGYYKDYYKLMWPYLLLFIVIFFSSYLLLFYIGNVDNLFILISSAIMISMFVLMPFLPLVLNLNLYKVKYVMPVYIREYNKFLSQELKKNKQFEEFLKQNEEQAKKYQETIDKLNKSLNQDDTDNDNDSDNKDN